MKVPAKTTKTNAKLKALFEQIARDTMLVETLERRMLDSLDFHDVPVWCIEAALQAAYDAGYDAGHQAGMRKRHSGQ